MSYGYSIKYSLSRLTKVVIITILVINALRPVLTVAFDLENRSLSTVVVVIYTL